MRAAEEAAAALYGGESNCCQGATVAFSVLAPSGDAVGHWAVWRAADACGVALRAGCMCNPGACQAATGATSSLIIERGLSGAAPCASAAGGSDGLVGGQPTGAVRLSFCHMSCVEDAVAAVECIEAVFRDADARCDMVSSSSDGSDQIRARQIHFYP